MSESVREIDPEVRSLIVASRNSQSWDELEQPDVKRQKHWEDQEDSLARSITARLSPESERDRVRVSEPGLHEAIRQAIEDALIGPAFGQSTSSFASSTDRAATAVMNVLGDDTP